MPYSDTWRSLRKISHALLNQGTSASYRPVQDFESKQLISDLLHAKDDWAFYDINRRYSAAVILMVTYGRRVATLDDPFLKEIFEVLRTFNQAGEPGTWLVDSVPFLTKLPSKMVQNWKAVGKAWHKQHSGLYLKLYREMVQKVQDGTAAPCFAKDFYLSKPEEQGIDEEQAAFECGSLVEAGSDSTSIGLNAWALVLLLYPETMKQAQEELDRVVGSDRLPVFEDEPNLPYLRAMVKETLRFWPITKTGAPPHATTEGTCSVSRSIRDVADPD